MTDPAPTPKGRRAALGRYDDGIRHADRMVSYRERFDETGRVLPGIAAALSAVRERLGVDVTITRWIDEEEGIDLVLSDPETSPRRPVWEVFRIVNGEGDCLAVHPFMIGRMSGADSDIIEGDPGCHEVAAAASAMACIIRWHKTGKAPEYSAVFCPPDMAHVPRPAGGTDD